MEFPRPAVRPRLTDVAVAVATLDRPEGLERCLKGVLAGETLPRELIVVDQGTADVRSVVELFALRPGVSVRHVRQARLGLSAFRNGAVRLTTSPILAFTDDDCVPEPGWLTAIAAAFQSSPQLGSVTGPMLPLGPPSGHLCGRVSGGNAATGVLGVRAAVAAGDGREHDDEARLARSCRWL